jgi:hypothetical protein
LRGAKPGELPVEQPTQAFEAMFTKQGHAAQALGDRVRAASRHRGPWPKISVWHGASDPIVKPFADSKARKKKERSLRAMN